MYCIHHGHPVPVKVSSNNNLIGPGSALVGRAGEPWPAIYRTEADAWAVLEARDCEHRWIMDSHEERRCTHCGAVQFVADI